MRKRESNPGFAALEVDALTTRPTRRAAGEEAEEETTTKTATTMVTATV